MSHWWLTDDLAPISRPLHGPGDVAVRLELAARAAGPGSRGRCRRRRHGHYARGRGDSRQPVTEVAGALPVHDVNGRRARMMLAKKPRRPGVKP